MLVKSVAGLRRSPLCGFPGVVILCLAALACRTPGAGEPPTKPAAPEPLPEVRVVTIPGTSPSLVSGLAWSPDGALVAASLHGDPPGELALWFVDGTALTAQSRGALPWPSTVDDAQVVGGKLLWAVQADPHVPTSSLRWVVPGARLESTPVEGAVGLVGRNRLRLAVHDERLAVTGRLADPVAHGKGAGSVWLRTPAGTITVEVPGTRDCQAAAWMPGAASVGVGCVDDKGIPVWAQVAVAGGAPTVSAVDAGGPGPWRFVDVAMRGRRPEALLCAAERCVLARQGDQGGWDHVVLPWPDADRLCGGVDVTLVASSRGGIARVHGNATHTWRAPDGDDGPVPAPRPTFTAPCSTVAFGRHGIDGRPAQLVVQTLP